MAHDAAIGYTLIIEYSLFLFIELLQKYDYKRKSACNKEVGYWH